MRRNGRLLIILGVTLAVAAVGLAVFALTGGDDKSNDTGSSGTPAPSKVFIVRAKREIPAHTILKADDVEEVQVSANEVSPDAVQSTGEVIGFSYSIDLTTEQRLLRSNLEQPGLANELAEGTRAVAIPVDQASLIGGLLRDDDHVDLIYTISVDLLRILPTEPIELPDELQLRDIATTLPPYGESPGATYPYPGEAGSRFTISDTADGDPQAKLVLQNLRVIRVVADTGASSGSSQVSSGEGGYVVLEVNAEQSELLTFMATYGRVQLALRSPDDASTAETPGINLERMVTQYGFPYPKSVRVPGPGAQ